jgi:beta-glucanase (GH16 family)
MFRKLTIALAIALAIPALPATTASAAFSIAMPVGDLPGWHQTFAEDFDVSAPLGGFTSSAYYNARFRSYGPSNPTFASWRDTAKHGWYMPQIISVENGVLTKNIQTVNGRPYVAAVVPQIPIQTYGRYSIRMRSDTLPAYKMAFMLWPQSGKNKIDGEIDWPEKSLNSTTLMGFMHKTDQVAGPVQQGWAKVTPFDSTQYHVYTIEWSPKLVTLILDGVTVKSFTDRIPSTPMSWILQTETQIAGGAPIPAASTKGNVEIAWVAAWSYIPRPTTTL